MEHMIIRILLFFSFLQIFLVPKGVFAVTGGGSSFPNDIPQSETADQDLNEGSAVEILGQKLLDKLTSSTSQKIEWVENADGNLLEESAHYTEYSGQGTIYLEINKMKKSHIGFDLGGVPDALSFLFGRTLSLKLNEEILSIPLVTKDSNGRDIVVVRTSKSFFVIRNNAIEKVFPIQKVDQDVYKESVAFHEYATNIYVGFLEVPSGAVFIVNRSLDPSSPSTVHRFNSQSFKEIESFSTENNLDYYEMSTGVQGYILYNRRGESIFTLLNVFTNQLHRTNHTNLVLRRKSDGAWEYVKPLPY